MAQNDALLAEYPQQPVVRRRNYASLIQWAFGTRNVPLPGGKPPVEFVKLRLCAERIPQQIDSYVNRTLPYFLQSQTTQTNIRQFMNAFNDEATEVALSGQNADVIANFMPTFANADVSLAQVEQWYMENGFAHPEPIEVESRGRN